MSYELLGPSFDIHGGGLDLQFPHHENELAQSCCAHPEASFAGIWMHNEMLQVEGKKMSKSLGNFFTVRDLLDQGVPGEVIRFVLLSTHYSKPMDWTKEKAEQAEATLRKWRKMVAEVEESAPLASVIASLSDDLNTAGALTELHIAANKGDFAGLKASAALLGLLHSDLGNWVDVVIADQNVDDIINRIFALWIDHRAAKRFEIADSLKNSIATQGVGFAVSVSGATISLNPEYAKIARLSDLIAIEKAHQ
jgi:cysteinyl-tRNA synthetase